MTAAAARARRAARKRADDARRAQQREQRRTRNGGTSQPVVECEECGRVGSDGFVWFQGEIMLCVNEASCKQRAKEKEASTSPPRKPVTPPPAA